MHDGQTCKRYLHIGRINVMREQEAIERIIDAIQDNTADLTPRQVANSAHAAWNEMKAIAREDAGKCRVVPGLQRLDTERKAAERGYL